MPLNRAKLPGWAKHLTRIIRDNRLVDYDNPMPVDRSVGLPLQETAGMPQTEKDAAAAQHYIDALTSKFAS
jgi:hypothetical protein